MVQHGGGGDGVEAVTVTMNVNVTATVAETDWIETVMADAVGAHVDVDNCTWSGW